MKTTWLTLLVFLLLAAPATVQAQSGSGDGFNYTINPDNTNTIAITKYTGSGSVVTIPTNINALMVTSIGVVGNDNNPVFSFQTSVTIPDSVTSIGFNAFGNCSSLTNVTIPASVTNIGVTAFIYCFSLTGFTVDTNNSFYSSLNGVLFDKRQATLIQYPLGSSNSYTVPGTVTTIGQYAF